jgi:hypothetical protein
MSGTAINIVTAEARRFISEVGVIQISLKRTSAPVVRLIVLLLPLFCPGPSQISSEDYSDLPLR